MKLKYILLLGVLLSVPAPLLASEAHWRAFGPQKLVHVAKPTVRWEVWPGRGSSVTSAKMTVNGRTVRATYDEEKRVLVYTPSEPLAAGNYKIACRVVIDDHLPVTKDWDFKIVSNAIVTLPEPTDDQRMYIWKVNEIRAALGLPGFDIDARLCAAAMAHTNYLAKNGLTGHYERPGDPAFVGQAPADRLDAFGYSQGSWEGVDFGPQAPEESVERLYNAPYHRLPFLQPGRTYIGAGFAPSHMTINFGMAEESGTVVSPADGQKEIPLSWRGPEMPDPLAVHGIDGVVGYPIVLAHFTPNSEKIVVESASLETALGKAVPFYLNTPKNDRDLEFATFVIPKKTLTPNTGYVVTVSVRTEKGKDISRTWKFVTGSR